MLVNKISKYTPFLNKHLSHVIHIFTKYSKHIKHVVLVLSVLDPELGEQLSEATVGDFLATALFFCNIMPFLKPARLGTPTPLHVSHQQNRRAVNYSGPTRLPCNLDRLPQLLPVSSHHWSCRLLYGRREMSVPQNTHKVPSVVVRETRSGRRHQFVLIFVWFIFQLTLRAD